MKYLIDNYKQFEELQSIKSYIKIADVHFPPNCTAWVGASLLCSLNTEIDRFCTTYEEFKDNGNKLPDRFGDAFLHAMRDEMYLNPDFEYKNQFAK